MGTEGVPSASKGERAWSLNVSTGRGQGLGARNDRDDGERGEDWIEMKVDAQNDGGRVRGLTKNRGESQGTVFKGASY